MKAFAALCAIALSVASPARADGPAVSTLNGKASIEGGAISTRGQSSAIGIVQGSLTSPLGHAYGLQLDGLAATSYGQAFGGGAAHLFWRNPAVGLFGPVAFMSGGQGTRFGGVGAEAEIYAPSFTVAGVGGYFDVDAAARARSANGGFYFGRLTVYPVDDVALSLSGGQAIGRVLGIGRLEFQPAALSGRGLSVFLDGRVGDDSFYRVTAGLRLYFGPPKSLIRRHREDDPVSAPLSADACFSCW